MALINNFDMLSGSALGNRDLRCVLPSVAYSDSSSPDSNSGLGPSGGESIGGSQDKLDLALSGHFLCCRLYRGLVLLNTLPLISGSVEMVVLGFSSGLVVFPLLGNLFLLDLSPGDDLGDTRGGTPGGGGAGCDVVIITIRRCRDD